MNVVFVGSPSLDEVISKPLAVVVEVVGGSGVNILSLALLVELSTGILVAFGVL